MATGNKEKSRKYGHEKFIVEEIINASIEEKLNI